VILAKPIAVALTLTGVLDKLGIRYVVGGSLASSMHGIPRSTQDLDLLVELPDDFFIDRDMALDAVARHGSFNILHLKTMFKVDLFVSGGGPLLVDEMERAEEVDLGDPPRPVRVCSAEDVVVLKLDWFNKGGRVSERQWRDLVGVLTVQGSRVDLSYVRQWAGRLGLADLLERALRESRLVEP
jgi:hypothetical protein